MGVFLWGRWSGNPAGGLGFQGVGRAFGLFCRQASKLPLSRLQLSQLKALVFALLPTVCAAAGVWPPLLSRLHGGLPGEQGGHGQRGAGGVLLAGP